MKADFLPLPWLPAPVHDGEIEVRETTSQSPCTHFWPSWDDSSFTCRSRKIGWADPGLRPKALKAYDGALEAKSWFRLHHPINALEFKLPGKSSH